MNHILLAIVQFKKNEKIFEKTIDKSQQVWYDYIIKGEMFLQYTFNSNMKTIHCMLISNICKCFWNILLNKIDRDKVCSVKFVSIKE